MSRIFPIIFGLIGVCLGQVDRDWSLEAMCTFHAGEYTKRSDATEPNPVGDRCQFTFEYAVDADLARKFCEETVPYHIIEAKLNGQWSVDCLAETGLICKKDWIQVNGRCYQMKKKLMTYSDAVDYCAAQSGATIGFIHREIMPVHWRNYYSKVSKMWVDASEVIKNDLVYNEGPDMMLVLNGWHYGVKSFSLIRVNGTAEKAMVLCEYTPPMTREESTYLIRRYSEIYHPGFTAERGMYLRTANYLIADDSHRTMPDDYCKKVMKPFVSTNAIKETAAAVDDVTFHKGLRQTPDQQLNYYRSGTVVGGVIPANRRTPHCYAQPLRKENLDIVWETDRTVCDGASWSYYLRMNPEKSKWAINVFSDARSAPIYCQTTFNTLQYLECPSGYTKYTRKNGVRFCHKYFPNKLNKAAAGAKCMEDGAYLTGIEDRAEMDALLENLLPKSGGEDRAWIGAERRHNCRYGFQNSTDGWRDGDDECSRELVFEWENGVSLNPPNINDCWVKPREPNYSGLREHCLEIIRYDGQGLNDLDCNHPIPFICGKEAEIQAVQ